MIHKLCDSCCECESVDSMIQVDDDIYCAECYEKMELTDIIRAYVKMVKDKDI